MAKDKLATGEEAGPDRATAAPQPAAHGAFRWRRLWPLLVLALLALGLYAAGIGKYLTLSFIVREHEHLKAAVADNVVRATITYLGVYVVAVAVSFPGAFLLTVVGGLVFGAVLGTGLTVVAATIGATILFLAARSSLGSFLREKVGNFAGRFAAGFEENAFSYLFLLRLVPIFPFWLINVAPALFNVPVRTYVVATALGIVPGTLAYSLVGDGLSATIHELEAQDPGCAAAGTCTLGFDVLVSPGPLIAMAALCVVAVIPLVVKALRARRNRTP